MTIAGMKTESHNVYNTCNTHNTYNSQQESLLEVKGGAHNASNMHKTHITHNFCNDDRRKSVSPHKVSYIHLKPSVYKTQFLG